MIKQSRNFSPCFFIITLVLIIDRLSKWWVLSALTEGQSLPVSFFFHLTRVHNTGIAFGFFKDFRVPLIGISLICVIVFAAMLWRRRNVPLPNLTDLALSLIIGGALGNLADRLVYGYVLDFIDFRIWPVFNAADASISIGVGLALLQILRKRSFG